ncbi:MAG TPA: cyclic pyranopterin monophosphate synthase MoaC [Anaerolineales bacterium]|nr:cyclic pyranopterin monophosphate synthase MoaC [Anaerolineales bacterium]
MNVLTHLDEHGNAHMVDVSQKPVTARTATARGEIHMQAETLTAILQGNLKKGDVFGVAQLAGILGAKHTSTLIPLCHPLPLSSIHVQIQAPIHATFSGLEVTATVRTTATTGVEMEALTAVSIALLTVYDMAKAVEKTMHIHNIRLVEKRGGQSGDVFNE